VQAVFIRRRGGYELQSSLRRHHNTGSPIHERGLREPRHVTIGNGLLRPDRRAANLGRRAGPIRANHEIGIEDGEQALAAQFGRLASPAWWEVW
jgi:hypothetical protein